MSPPSNDALKLGEAPEGFRSGFVSIVGRPNVGKSTLLNQILRSKVAITSERPQTTRHTIRGIHTTSDAQLVFVDTPGLHKPVTALGKRLNRTVRTTVGEVDVAVFVLDVSAGVGSGDAFMAEVLRKTGIPVVVALNKADLVDAQRLASGRKRAEGLGTWTGIFVTSARTGHGIATLIRGVSDLLPEGPLYYPPETVTDQPERRLIAELVREKLLELTHEEVPHSVAVVVDEIEAGGDDGTVNIEATVYVERDSQKGIVIGKSGRLLKEVGTRARAEIEAALDAHVFLRLRVKVEPDWQRREALVERFGYGI